MEFKSTADKRRHSLDGIERFKAKEIKAGKVFFCIMLARNEESILCLIPTKYLK